MKKWAALLVILIAIATYIYFVGFGSEFAIGHEKLQEICLEYGLDEYSFTPAEENLGAFVSDLQELREEIAANPESADQKALLLLVDSRLDLAEMQKALLEARDMVDLVDRAAPDCLPGGEIEQIKEKLDAAQGRAELAKVRLDTLVSDYPKQAETAGIEEDLLGGIVIAARSIATQTKANLDSLCRVTGEGAGL